MSEYDANRHLANTPKRSTPKQWPKAKWSLPATTVLKIMAAAIFLGFAVDTLKNYF